MDLHIQKRNTGVTSKYNVNLLNESLESVVSNNKNHHQEMRQLLRFNRLLDACEKGLWPEDSLTIYLCATKLKREARINSILNEYPDLNPLQLCFNFD